MLGTVANALAIVIGGAAGLLAGRSLPEPVRQAAIQGIGLAVLLIGLQMSLRAGPSPCRSSSLWPWEAYWAGR
ncbi:MAG: DUF554 family protein [bacterium]|nr:DUF554 family protein [bacterium]